ncbi:hypothetical protein [Microvirga pakistanensis]|uniref:hypothetical protein n=1 Tax=Microvirga pakistanensis TaxID=1682650 RepID=UPI00106C8666|nr:hypothetical protein [Microvirga pakistanensis]
MDWIKNYDLPLDTDLWFSMSISCLIAVLQKAEEAGGGNAPGQIFLPLRYAFLRETLSGAWGYAQSVRRWN